jgi:ABC-type molybdate transport system substrate-binding protein
MQLKNLEKTWKNSENTWKAFLKNEKTIPPVEKNKKRQDPKLTNDAHLNSVSASAAAPPQAPCRPYPVQEPHEYYIMKVWHFQTCNCKS